MLPITPEGKEGSRSDLIETAPRMDLSVQDIEHLVEALRASHALYSPLLQRRAQREVAHTSIQGVLATLPRKSMEPMALAVDGVAPAAVRALQSFSSAGRGNDGRLVHQPWQAVERDLGADAGVLMVDGRDVPKQGVHAVGVQRPYCGEWGQRANGRAGVFGGSGHLPGLPHAGSSVVCACGMADRRRVCGNGAGRGAFRQPSRSTPSPRWPRR